MSGLPAKTALADSAAMNERAKSLREDFPILRSVIGKDCRPLVYLDNAATTQKPKQVIDAIAGYYEKSNANVHRSIHELGERSTALLEGARERVRRFVHAASREEIVFTKGTTESINLVASSCSRLMKPGDEILLTVMEHHANLVSWQIAAAQHGLIIRYADMDESGELRLDDFDRLIGPRTRLVALAHMSNVLGTINPIREIAALARSRGAKVLVDSAQAAARTAIDVRDLGVDFLAFSGHKIAGPMGIGVLYGEREALAEMPPWQGGGEMIRSVSLDGFEANDLPFKFEAGTPNVEGAVGLAAALDYVEAVSLPWIGKWERSLTEKVLAGLEAIDGIRVYGHARDRGGIVSFEFEGIHAHDLAAYLDSLGIAVRAGHHCAQPLHRRLGAASTARASFFLYNTMEEADYFLEAMKEARGALP
jgi:cysteine desulfurase/selenocysteine lyase